MNINTLNEFIEDFRHQVVESGFKRDVTDYVSSLPSLEENIVSLRATATSVLGVLSSIHASDLPSALVQLFPSKKPIPFTKGHLWKPHYPKRSFRERERCGM